MILFHILFPQKLTKVKFFKTKSEKFENSRGRNPLSSFFVRKIIYTDVDSKHDCLVDRQRNRGASWEGNWDWILRSKFGKRIGKPNEKQMCEANLEAYFLELKYLDPNA